MSSLAEVIDPLRNTRRHARIEVNLPAKIERAVGVRDALIINVAAGGAFIRAHKPADVGSPISLHFRMLAQRKCFATGRVVWRGDSGFGVEFEETNPAMESFMRSLSKLPEHLRQLYLADILDPHIELDETTTS